MKAVRDLPHLARKPITFDRGTELVSWPHLQAEIGTQTWFCDPSSPWQKGTVENTNRRSRRWLPRKSDITAVSDHELNMICDRLNATPRKCLGWKTPAEVFREKTVAVQVSLTLSGFAITPARSLRRGPCVRDPRRRVASMPCADGRCERRLCGCLHRCRDPIPGPAAARGSRLGPVFP